MNRIRKHDPVLIGAVISLAAFSLGVGNGFAQTLSRNQQEVLRRKQHRVTIQQRLAAAERAKAKRVSNAANATNATNATQVKGAAK